MRIKAEHVPSIVTAAAFTASAAHIVSVVDETNPLLVALVYPFGIDGLIYVGIDAMQKRRKAVGTVALLIGSVYSLLFNADAEKALTMHPLLIAASMPVCLFASFLIAYTGKKVEPAVERIVERVEVPVEVERIVAPALLPIVPPAPRRRPTPIKRTITPTPARTDETKVATAGRTIAWDVAKAVRLMDEGRTNAQIAETLSTAEKQMQRARRVLGLVRSTDLDDAAIRAEIKNALSLPVIAEIRAAATPKEA